MNNLILDSEAGIRLALFCSVFLALALAELIWPRRKPAAGKGQRWMSNLSISVINTVLVRLLIPVAGVAAAALAQDNGWGLFNLLQWPSWLELVVFLVVFDLAIYWQHRLYHLVPILWRFHRVHHTDQDYDLTTGNRFHPISILLSALIKIGLVLLFGASALAILTSELLLNISSMFNHSNVRLGPGLDNALRTIVVTPDMHRIHHSLNEIEHNRNFGFNFSCWDRLFGSYLQQSRLPQESMPLGIEGFAGVATRQLPYLLVQPMHNPQSK